ncbi:metallophosphoesterase [Aliikangiella sp. IMCC44653]
MLLILQSFGRIGLRGLMCALFQVLSFAVSANTTDVNLTGVSKSEQQAVLDYNDGPYIFITPQHLQAKSIRQGKVVTHVYPLNHINTSFAAEASEFKTAENIAAISDIHGQHKLFIQLLKAHHIIDHDDKWSFGAGHLVIVGDIFDRGPQVLDSLWFIFELEQQASAAGGKVHFLLGNHEYMVLLGDLRYLHANYRHTEKLLNQPYQALFNQETLLGRWLRSKSSVIKINDTLFVHGGISKALAERKLSLAEINNKFRQSLNLSRAEIKLNKQLAYLYASDGPIWYRGYFGDNKLQSNELNKILAQYQAKRVVVGHTSSNQVESHYSGKVLLVDSSIKKAESGEILLLNAEQTSRGLLSGKVKSL